MRQVIASITLYRNYETGTGAGTDNSTGSVRSNIKQRLSVVAVVLACVATRRLRQGVLSVGQKFVVWIPAGWDEPTARGYGHRNGNLAVVRRSEH